ncbi:hypothetical protein [Sporosarcina sp. P33]|uniref:hypothetical protein n=1 Tax=Sporosarcina sp. P33 TaxID=1930764 RepID=UPI0009C0042D|nr:hypothetical protein [Sporosarcina sp. P33]ARD49051.1 hypothetical protein SporoP33_12930 [Sporosarcina sp. P33]
MDIKQYIKTAWEGLPNAPTELAPSYLGKFFQMVKNKQFDRRIKKVEEPFLRVLQMIPLNDFKYFEDKIGPIVIQRIFLDDEDDKAEFLILGFENCVKNEIKDEDLIIYYFDLISELRVLDLKRLVSFSGRTDETPIRPEESSKEELLLHSSDIKLNRLGLIQVKMGWSSENGDQINYNFPIELTKRGNKFLDFIGF